MSDQPAWASEPAAQNPAPSAPMDDGRGSSVGQQNEHPHKEWFMSFCTFIHLGLSLMVSWNGALAIAATDSTNDAGSLFVGLYMILFAIILFTFEMLQLMPGEALDNIFKKNFGFLYGNLGKSCYILFVGILSFGLSNPSWSIATGILMVAWGFIHAGVAFMRPELFDQKTKYNPNFQ